MAPSTPSQSSTSILIQPYPNPPAPPLPAQVVRLHVPSILRLGNLLPHGFVLRSLQLCASLRVRGAFTSDRTWDRRSQHQTWGIF